MFFLSFFVNKIMNKNKIYYLTFDIFSGVSDDAPEMEVTPDEMSEEASSIAAVEVTLGGAVTLQCPNGAAGCWSRVGSGGRLEAVGPGPRLSLNRVLYQEGGEYRCLVGRNSRLDRLRSHNVQVSVVGKFLFIFLYFYTYLTNKVIKM